MGKHTAGASWRKIAQIYGVKAGTLCRFARNCYVPKSEAFLKALGLPVLKEAPACPKCGAVHVSKRCTADKMSPHNRAEIEKFITWARVREASRVNWNSRAGEAAGKEG